MISLFHFQRPCDNELKKNQSTAKPKYHVTEHTPNENLSKNGYFRNKLIAIAQFLKNGSISRNQAIDERNGSTLSF
ncbi:hypothetical protein KFK09_005040 [Dendrobium nobile]|uniref:Uncharacterized protein n=1 Tax=Dendrobium nobile TaxID=94219 RepID=A0A8T3BZV5_DENNO|nr:hypothetical protein KFK09_005040 [Dendrobium nobile]